MSETVRVTYAIQAVLKRRGEFMGSASDLVGKKMDATNFRTLCQAFHSRISDVPRSLVDESLRHLFDCELTLPLLRENAWRIAGNMPRLRSFHAAVPWNRQAFDEYVPLQIASMLRRFRGGDWKHEFIFQVLAGTSAPLKISKIWTPKFCGMLSGLVGFSKPWGKIPYRHPRQLVGMRFYVLIESKLSGALPSFEQLWVDDDEKQIRQQSCYEYNRQLVQLRNRRESGFECPENFPFEVDCHNCAVGLDQCPLATHVLTFTTQYCPRCSKETLFNEEASKRMCISCHTKQLQGAL